MEKISFTPKGAQYRVSTPNIETVKDFPYTFKWAKLPGKTVVVSRAIVTLINADRSAEAEIVFSVFSSRESFNRRFHSVSDLLRACDKVDTQRIVKESICKFYFDIHPPVMLESRKDRVELSAKRKPGLADENYVMCEGWMYDTEEVTVKDIMRPTTDIKEGIPVSKAVSVMAKQKVGALLVKKYEDVMLGQTVGIVTEQDFIQKVLNRGLDPKKLSVEKIMSAPLITISSKTSLDEAIEVMVKKKIRRLPVEEKGKIIGIVTDRDMIEAIPLYYRGASKKRIYFP